MRTNKLIYSHRPLILCCCRTSINNDIYVSCPFCDLLLLGNFLAQNKLAFTKVGGVAAEFVFMPSRWHTAILVPF